MLLKIVVRSRRQGERSPKADRRAGSDLTQATHDEVRGVVDQAKATNDNDKAWPLIPFPDGWYGC